MASDDYFVIVYRILCYLYVQLKNGEPINEEYLMPTGKLFKINNTYWMFIMESLINDGYISNVCVMDDILEGKHVCNLQEAQITTKGIKYLLDNSFLNRVKEFLKETKEMTPFL